MIEISRRGWLAGTSVGVAAVVGGLAWRAVDQGLFTSAETRPGFEPWRDVARGRYHGPLALAAAGVLAASPHNTQPWLFHVGRDQIDVHLVLNRNLGAFDPYRREMATALGCAVENMVQAAAGQNLLATVMPVTGEETRVARVALSPRTGQVAPLAAAIVRRHTNRHPYESDRAVPPSLLDKLQALATDPTVRLMLMSRGSDNYRRFGDETIAATETIIVDAAMSEASHRWTRSSRADVDRERSGLTLAGAGLDRLTETIGALLPPVDAQAEGHYWLDLTRKTAVPTAAVFGLLLVRDPYDRAQSLTAGRLWQRLHLAGTLLGLGMQPLNQIPEVIDRERDLGRPAAIAARIASLIVDRAWHPTFGFRLGYPTRSAAASPRRALAAAIAVSPPYK